MLWLHPILQALTTLLAIYVLRLGWKRFAANHLGRKAPFPWARHVLLGKIALLLWTAGFVGGASMAAIRFGGLAKTGDHFMIGCVMLVLIAIGFWTGLIMDRDRKKRAVLPLLHAANNTALVLLAFDQAYHGYRVILDWVL